MELKQVEVQKIFPNFSQPREHFDKEKIKELSESILGNGLINPIIIRQDGKKFFIVAGERRWQAHKLAGIKKIAAFVKEYKNDIDWQIESLVENIHREDLTSIERENFTFAIWNTGNFKNFKELSTKIGFSSSVLEHIISAKKSREELSLHATTKEKISTRNLLDTQGLEKRDKEKLLQKVADKEIGTHRVREIAKIIKKSSDEVKNALFDDKITVEQAERISKLKSEPERRKAIQEHQSLAVVEKAVEKNVEMQMTASGKRELDKKLLQAGNWILSFRNSVTDDRRNLEKTIKILLIATKFVPTMDDKQKEKLESELDRFIEMLERGEQLATQIKEQL